MFSDTMEKEQYRSVIRFLFLDGKTCEEIKTKLDAVYGNSSPSMTTVRYWFNEFKRGHSSVFDEKRPGRPSQMRLLTVDNKPMRLSISKQCLELFKCNSNEFGSSAVATVKLIELRYELLPHPLVSKLEKNGSVERNSRRMRRSSPKQRPILQSLTNLIFLKG
ncbi:SETMR methyltransferase, partial [Acromyrmex insinuator]